MLTLNQAPTSAITLNYQTVDTGSASAGDDFEVTAGTVSFAAGQTVATVSVPIIGDTTYEGNETFSLLVSGSSLAQSLTVVGTIRENDSQVVEKNDFTVTATEISTNNAIAGNNAISLDVGSSGTKTVTIQSDGVTADGGFIISGASANITVTAGIQGDNITVIGNGNNTITAGTGTGNDTITVVGTGNNTINVGAGNDNVTGGSGNDTIVFASGALTGTLTLTNTNPFVGDVVDGGAGTDTVRISGDNNVIGYDADGDGIFDAADGDVAGARLSNVENIVLDGTTITISTPALAGLSSISGSPASSRVTLAAAPAGGVATEIDMSGLSLTGLQRVTVENTTGGGAITLVLNKAQIEAVGSFTAATGDALAIKSDVAGLSALGSKATGATLTVSDTAENIAAASSLLSTLGVAVTSDAPVTVAKAAELLALGLTTTYELADTAANLALAPVAVFNAASSVTASTAATAAQAVAIDGIIDASNSGTRATDLGISTVTMSVSDTASNLANYTGGLYFADTITATGAATAAQAKAIFGFRSGAAATDDTLTTTAAHGLLDGDAIKLSADLALTGGSTVSAGTTVYVRDATSTTFKVAATSGGTALDIGTAVVSLSVRPAAATINYAVSDTGANYGTAGVTDAAFDHATSLALSGTANTVAQVSALDAGATSAITSGYTLTDSFANLVTGTSTNASSAATVTAAAGNIVVSDAGITVANAVSIEALSNSGTNSYVLSDTAALLLGASTTVVASASSAGVTASTGVTLTNASNSVTTASTSGLLVGSLITGTGIPANTTIASITNATTFVLSAAATASSASALATTATVVPAITAANMNALVTKYGTTKFADTDSPVSDTVANLLTLTANAVSEASNITISSGSASVDQAVSLNALTGAKMPTSSEGFAVSDTAANLVTGAGVAATVAILDDASSVTVSGAATVSQIETINAALTAETTGGAGLTAVATGYTLTDTAANLAAAGASAEVDAAATVNVSNATSIATLTTIDGYNTTGTAFVKGTTLTYSIRDTAANIITNTGSYRAGATTVSISDSGVTGDQAVSLDGYTNFDDVYAINDTYDEILGTGKNSSLTDSILNAAASVTITDSVSNLQASSSAALTAIAAATTDDRLVISDSLTNLTSAATATKSAATAFTLTNSVANGNEILASNAAEVNTLAALKPTTYTVTDAYANLVSAGAAASTAIGTLLSGAATIRIGTDAAGNNTLVYSALSVSQFNTLDGLTPATIVANLTDSIANLTSSTGATALANAVANGSTIAFTSGVTTATVAQAATLKAAGVPTATIATLDIVDTAANIQSAAATLLAGVDTITVSDNGSLTLSVASAGAVYDNANDGAIYSASVNEDGSAYGNYNLSDTAANLAAADADLVKFAKNVTATTTATTAEAPTLAGLSLMGTLSYNVSGTATAVAGITGSALNLATNVTATDAATVAFARTINDATNSGTTSYSISDAASTFVDANSTTQASIASAVNNATGTVTVTGTATGAQATTIAGFTKAVVYNISNTAVALDASTVSAGALNEAVAVTATGPATYAAAAKLMAATNSGTTTIAAASMTAAQAKSLVFTGNDVITTLTVTGTTTAADAAAIAALDSATTTVDEIGTLTISSISDTYANLMAAGTTVLNLGTAVTATDAMTVAQKTASGSSIDVYSLTDSWTNLMVNSDATGDVDADAMITAATRVTVTDATLTVAQATALRGVHSSATKYVYSIKDNDANIVAAMASADPTVLTSAASVTSADGVALDVATIGSTTYLRGTKAEISALSSVLKAANAVYETTVADLESDTNFYATLGSTKKFLITDTVANLTGGNSLIGSAIKVTVSDTATVAQATSIVTAAASASGQVVYNLADTAALLVAGSVLNGAVNVTATTAATQAQAEVIIDATNSGTTVYDISQLDTGVGAASSNAFTTATDAYNGARSVTITGTTGIDEDQAQAILATTAPVTIAKVADQTSDLITIAKGASDTITTMTVTGGAATVADITTLLTQSTSVTGYALSDTAANLAAAGATILNGASTIGLVNNGVATVAQAAIIDAATNSGANTYAIADTAANVLAADVTLLGTDSNDAIVVTDTSVTAATATALRAFDTANTGFTVGGSATGVYAISDSYAALTDAANSAAVSAGTVTVTDALTTTQAAAVKTLNSSASMALTGTYSQLAVYMGTSPTNITGITVTGTGITAAQANSARSWIGGTEVYAVRDTAANVANATYATAVAQATSVTLTGAATVAQAAKISDMTNVLSYTISDTAANVQAALDTANGSNASDRNAVLEASSITLTTNATVAEAAGVLGTESRGLYTIPGLTYSIADSGVNINTALGGADRAAVEGAASIFLDSTTGVSVSIGLTLTGLSNFVGYDHDSDSTTAARYYIEDSYANIQAADATLLDGATTVTATVTSANSTVDMSAVSRGVTVTGGVGADIITGTSYNDSISGGDTSGDVITGGVGADSLTGGSESDRFLFNPGDTVLTISGSGNSGSVTGFDVISDFSAGTGSAFSERIDLLDVSESIPSNGATNGIDSTLTVSSATIKSHSVSSGFVTFDSNDTYGTPLALSTSAHLAAAVQYLQANDLGNAGVTVAFDVGSDNYLFIQGDDDGTNDLDILVKLTGVQGSSVSTAGGTTSGLIAVGGVGTLTGDGGANTITGSAGSDSISGAAGDDYLIGDPGSAVAAIDTIVGGDGADYLRGSDASSAKTEGLRNDADLMFAGAQTTASNGVYSAGQDTTGSSLNASFQSVYAPWADQYAAYDGANVLEGRSGNDTLVASNGDDVFIYKTFANSTLDGASVTAATLFGTDVIHSFTLGSDYIGVVMDIGGGDYTFVNTSSGQHSGSQVYKQASLNGWSWTAGATAGTGTLSFNSDGMLSDLNGVSGSSTAGDFSITFVGLSGTVTSVDQFFIPPGA